MQRRLTKFFRRCHLRSIFRVWQTCIFHFSRPREISRTRKIHRNSQVPTEPLFLSCFMSFLLYLGRVHFNHGPLRVFLCVNHSNICVGQKPRSSDSRGRGLESQHCILDGRFFTLICGQNCINVCL